MKYGFSNGLKGSRVEFIFEEIKLIIINEDLIINKVVN